MSDEREIVPHYLDDPDIDIARDEADSRGWGFLYAHLALALVSLSAWQYFHKPLVPIQFVYAAGAQWKAVPPVYVDGETHTITCPAQKPWYDEMPWDKK